MANPTRADVHIDTLATSFSVQYKNSMYIADGILPVVRVAKETGKYAKFTKDSWFRNEAKVRAPGTRAVRVEYSMDTPGSYTCLEYAASYVLDDRMRENADDPLSPERTAAELVTDKILLAREIRAAAAVFNATTFSSYTATAAALTGGAGVAWSTYETSDPLQDVNVMADNVRASIGRRANVLVMGAAVYKALKVHPAILDRVKWTQLGIVTTDLLASLFDMDKVLIGNAIYTSSVEGTTATYSDVWGSYVLAAFVNPAPALESPSLGYLVTHKDRVVNRYRDEQAHSDVFECLENMDEIICAADAGYLLTSVVS